MRGAPIVEDSEHVQAVIACADVVEQVHFKLKRVALDAEASTAAQEAGKLRDLLGIAKANAH